MKIPILLHDEKVIDKRTILPKRLSSNTRLAGYKILRGDLGNHPL